MESIFVKFSQYPSIETERLLLRPVTLDDADAMLLRIEKIHAIPFQQIRV